MPKATHSSVLVSDFDGTMTRHDFYQLARARWWNLHGPDPWQDYLAGRMVSAALRFARGHLAAALEAEHLAFNRLEGWAKLADVLLEIPRK